MSVFPMESRSPAATDGLVALVLAAIQYSQTGSAWDQLFPGHSAGSATAASCHVFWCICMVLPICSKTAIETCNCGNWDT